MLTTLGPCDELFHTATSTAFADLLIDGHRETWPIHSKRFRSGSGGDITRRLGRPQAPRRRDSDASHTTRSGWDCLIFSR
jgi:hypothetical protein